MIKKLLFLLTALLILPAGTRAERIELKDGKVYEGRILAQDSSTVMLETSEAIVSIAKKDFKGVPDVPEVAPVPPASTSAPRKPGKITASK